MKSTARIAGVLCCACCANAALSQELEPRSYSPAPVGLNFFVMAGTRSTGEVLTDPSVPIQDVEARLNAGAAAYGRTFGIAGHQASMLLVVPYVWGDISGNVFEEARSVTRSGLADTKLRLAVNLIGGEALSVKEFMKRTPRTTLGTSLSISAPTGQYDPTKLINIGTNRWAFKPEVGLTIPHPVQGEAAAGVVLLRPAARIERFALLYEAEPAVVEVRDIAIFLDSLGAHETAKLFVSPTTPALVAA